MAGNLSHARESDRKVKARQIAVCGYRQRSHGECHEEWADSEASTFARSPMTR